MASSNQRLLEKLRQLTPSEFENFSFDLLLLKGMQNLSWRTPGPDGGRDLEGQFIVYDLSESHRIEKWYVECKRYTANVDWPTVFKKIAYAENHLADYLLFVTTSLLTPQCKSEVLERERSKKVPFVRYWDATILPKLIDRYPILSFKYGFENEDALESESILPLLRITSKTIQCAYGTASVDKTMNKTLELSAALVDLMSARLSEKRIGRLSVAKRFVLDRDTYEWCEIEDGVSIIACDSYGLRALLSSIRFFSKSHSVRLKKCVDALFDINIHESQMSEQFRELLTQISIWSNLEFFFANSNLKINTRK